jgi:hypothetical protein
VHYARILHVPVAADELFAWHERPGAFERLAPPWQRVEVLQTDRSVRDGARVRIRARVAPPALAPLYPVVDPLAALVVRDEWLVEHRDYVAGRQFRDVMLEGPFARWTHLHRVDPDGAAASRLTDDVDFALPFGPLGAAVGGALARRELDRLFRYRHAVTAADLARHADARARGVAPMTVAVTGASGMIGSALVPFLTAGGHTVVRVGRGAPGPAAPQRRDVRWDPARGLLDPAALDGVDAVVHLAGANVGGRWTAAYRDEIARSRVDATRLVAETVARMERPPRVVVSMSGSGYYGDRGDEPLDESAPPGRGFLAEVAQRWEAAADPARAAGVRVVHPRLGVVLSPRGGALARLLPPFQAGVGGPTGSGRQWWALAGLDDVLGALHFLVTRDDVDGPVNVSLPEPARNADFARALARVLGRPALVPTPAFALRLALGRQQADEMLLASQRLVPRRLLAAGFAFRHPTAEAALRFELGR